MVESIRMLGAYPNSGRISRCTSGCNKFCPHLNLWPGPLSPTPACYALLSIPPCCPLYINVDRVLREEGGGGVEEGSRVTCVETNGVKFILNTAFSFVVCTNLPLIVYV